MTETLTEMALLIKILNILDDEKFGELKAELFAHDENVNAIRILFKGRHPNGLINTSMMESVIAMQKQIHQLYADIFYSGNIRRLTIEDKHKLEFYVKIEEGSTIIEIFLSSLIAKFVDTIFSEETNMDNVRQMAIFILVLLLLHGGGQLVKWFLNRKSSKQIEEDKKAKIELEKLALQNQDMESQRKYALEHARLEAQIETMRIMQSTTQASANQVEKVQQVLADNRIMLSPLAEQAEKVAKPLLSAAEKADHVTFEGIAFDAEVASTLKSTVPEDKVQVQLSGVYRIQVVNSKEPGIFKVLLWDTGNREEFWAAVPENDTSGIQEVVQRAEWNKKALYLTIKATKRYGDLQDASIIRAEWLE